MATNANKECTLHCSCSRPDHIVRLTRFDDAHGNPPDYYMEVVLRPENNLWRRLKSAVMYLWNGTTCKYGNSAEVVLERSDMKKLKDFLDDSK